MSFDVNWDIDKYKEDHESEEHWQLRRVFMERWKHNYPEERLVCLARIFANMEFMGCRYPPQVMHEVARLSSEVAQSYRNTKKTKLQRTFVSASTAAEDRAKGVKRQGGLVIDEPAPKSSRIEFVRQGQSNGDDESPTLEHENITEDVTETVGNINGTNKTVNNEECIKRPEVGNIYDYFSEMMNLKCIPVKSFRDSMFQTVFGNIVLLIRPWGSKFWNIRASCQVCKIVMNTNYENGCLSVTLNGKLLAQATGETKQDAKSIVEIMAWNRLKEEVVSVIVKEQYIAQGDARIGVDDVTDKKMEAFGTPIESSIASKMMQMMGWKGGGLGADAQGIAEPIKPNLQMVNRAGLGSSAMDIRQLRRSAQELMRRYMNSDTLDVDLVFSSDFSKEERAALHMCAKNLGLASRSYGENESRFLVVKKKLDPFSLVRAVIEKGGNTPKYQVFIPAALNKSVHRGM